MTFYFYDVETSGFNARSARIMQFGGQRTDMDLKPIGQPDNILIKLSEDILPDPDAILVHGITPQLARADGMGEAEFLRYFSDKISTPETIFVGFNSIRFDDEFMRFSLWRNFYDAYEWQYKDKRGKWDLLDVVRMMRALRPEGVKWPFGTDGKASNRLELVAGINKLEHGSAHDALSDVSASIAVARLIRNKQTKLFDYLLKMRDKTHVAALVETGEPFVYTSGRYPSEFEKTTVAVMVAKHPQGRGAYVYDLRTDPAEFVKLPASQLAEAWQKRGKDAPYFPVKLLAYNRCPAIAPLSVLDKDSIKRLKLNMLAPSKVLSEKRGNTPISSRQDLGAGLSINDNLKQLLKSKDFGGKIIAADELIKKPQQPKLILDELQVDGLLYDGFVSNDDKNKMSVVRAASEHELKTLQLDFTDERLKLLFPLYKARNYPKTLSDTELGWWEKFKAKRLLDGGRTAEYFTRIEELKKRPGLTTQDKYLLKELQLYGEAVLPAA